MTMVLTSASKSVIVSFTASAGRSEKSLLDLAEFYVEVKLPAIKGFQQSRPSELLKLVADPCQ